MADKKPMAFAQHARTPEQTAQMEASVRTGKCVFCEDGDFRGFDPDKNKVIGRGTYWFYWENPYPYPGHSNHFVLATRAHTTNVCDLPPEAFAELLVMIQKIIKTYDLPGGGIVMRFGDNDFNAGTIAHTHVHIQVPDNTGPSMTVFAKDEVFEAFLSMINPGNPEKDEQTAAFLEMRKSGK